jgi:hypothetical protein
MAAQYRKKIRINGEQIWNGQKVVIKKQGSNEKSDKFQRFRFVM